MKLKKWWVIALIMILPLLFIMGNLKKKTIETAENNLKTINKYKNIKRVALTFDDGPSSECTKGWSPTVRPPRLGGNVRMGVFATRAPFRPNPIGLSAVRLERVELHPLDGPVLHLSGVDLVDGTPILDIKPYVPLADCIPEASEGFTAVPYERLDVEIPESFSGSMSPEERSALEDTLSLDPRPQYQDDPERVYGLLFSGWEVKFKVKDKRLRVLSLERRRSGAGLF